MYSFSLARDYQEGVFRLSVTVRNNADRSPDKIPPCKVLVIGAGVAGLSAIATVRGIVCQS